MTASFEERLERAERGGPAEIRQLVHDSSLEVLDALLRNPFLSEEHLLTLLYRKDLPRELLEAVASHEQWAQSQRVRVALVEHPRTPRLLALRLVKFLYLFDLVNVALQPAAPAEIKRLAEDQIINRAPQLALGQQVALARRGTARVVAALLLEGLGPVIGPGLDNPLLTEGAVLGLLRRDDLAEELVEKIAKHRKWSVRYDVRLQLVRHPLTPLGVALGFLGDLKVGDLKIIARDKRMRPEMRGYVRVEVERRLKR